MYYSDGQDLAGWMRTRMAARRMSQRQLAHHAGVDPSTVSRLLRGRPPTLVTATKIVRVLGIYPNRAVASAYPRLLDGADAAARRGVESALRSDVMLSEEQVRVLVSYYVSVRSRADLRPAVATQPPAATVALEGIVP